MIRLCATCGKPIEGGYMTDDDEYFYAHEGKCFETYMDNTYGKHKWMELGNGEQDEFGGFYIRTANVFGGFYGTGIYYTECEDDEPIFDQERRINYVAYRIQIQR